MECKFCKSIFSNKSTLSIHMKTAKYCLELQNIKPEENKCEGCDKSFIKKFSYDRHIQLCIKLQCLEKFSAEIYNLKQENSNLKQENSNLNMIKNIYENTIENQEKQIKELQDKLENIAIKAVSKSTTTVNNNTRINQMINNLQPITKADIQEQSKYLTLDHIKDGASGYAKYALEYPLKDKIICVDYARRKIKYKDEEGHLVDDPEMTKLCQKFFLAIEDTNNVLLTDHSLSIFERLMNMNNDGNDEMTEEETERFLQISNVLLEDMMKAKTMRSEIEDIKKGNKPDFYHNFVKNVCSKTVI